MDSFNAGAWLVDRHVEEGRGDRVAVRCRGSSVRYAELQVELWRAQNLLGALGLSPGDRVAMVVQDDPTFPAFFLGALRSALVPVPLSTMLTGKELGPIVADCGAAVLVVSDTFVAGLDDLVAEAPGVTDVVVSGDRGELPIEMSRAGNVRCHGWDDSLDASEAPVAETTEATPAFWLYSSGTTGMPKGVVHLHGSLRSTAQTYADRVLRTTEADRFLSVAKLFFAFGLGNSLTFPFAVGATAILEPRPPTPASMIELIERERPTLFFASPGFTAAVLDAAPDPSTFASLRATVTAGESLPAKLQTRFAELTGQPVLDGIGSTELLHIFISNRLDAQAPGSSGWLVPGYMAELRDDEGKAIEKPDTPGNLYVRGPSAAAGYWERPDATAAAFVDGWVRTGDVYTRSADDTWTFLGRDSDMIKAGGIWVSPAEVESALIEHPDVLEAAVVGEHDDQGLEITVAFVVAAAGATPDPAELEAHCRSLMAAFKRPRRIQVVDELPKTATGKIKRFQLRDSLAGD